MSDERALQFADTNLLIYAYDVNAGNKHHLARTRVDSLWASRNGCISIQVLQEFYVVGSRVLPVDTKEDLRARIASLSEWHVHAPKATDIVEAIDLHRRYRISFWDAMIVHSARALGCSILWSEDLNHGQVFGDVTVRNPFNEVK